MARVLFVLGAGASHPVGIPVMANFLDKAEDLLKFDQGFITAADFALTFEVLAALQIVHAKSVVDLTNVESLFNLVEMGRLIGRLPGTDGTSRSIEAAGKSLRRVLTQTIERTCRFGLTSDHSLEPIGPYLALANHLRKLAKPDGYKEWAFVTFNYDVALDFALHWSNLEIDYGFMAPGPDPRGVPLFKLHGSLNWSVCGCGELIELPWGDFGKERLVAHDGRVAFVAATALLPGLSHQCGKANTGEPAIVPPSWNKTQYHAGFSRIWARAATELAAAENIVVIGYSLPKSDAFFHDLFRLGLPGPTRLRRFVVIDPSEASRERFRELLGPELRDRFEPHPWSFGGDALPFDNELSHWLLNQSW